ncbi:MAG: fluoride efflux transporter CrcB, partial [Pseudomonadota bacterium]
MRIALLSYAFVALGGALGAMARYAIQVWLQRGVEFPWGTLAANLSGCLLLGIVAQLVAGSAWFNEAGIIPDQYRLLFAVGFCGSFTTFSTYILELHTMVEKGEVLYAFSYFAASMIGGFALFFVGLLATRSML